MSQINDLSANNFIITLSEKFKIIRLNTSAKLSRFSCNQIHHKKIYRQISRDISTVNAFKKLTVFQAVKKFPTHYLPPNWSHNDTHECSSQQLYISLKSNFIIFSHLWPGAASCLFHSSLAIKTMHTSLLSPMRDKRPAPTPFDIIWSPE